MPYLVKSCGDVWHGLQNMLSLKWLVIAASFDVACEETSLFTWLFY